MPALNTTQGHQRIDTCKVIPLHRGHITHELHQHCEPQESGPTLIARIASLLDGFDWGVFTLSMLIGAVAYAWIEAGCPGLHLIGG